MFVYWIVVPRTVPDTCYRDWVAMTCPGFRETPLLEAA